MQYVNLSWTQYVKYSGQLGSSEMQTSRTALRITTIKALLRAGPQGTGAGHRASYRRADALREPVSVWTLQPCGWQLWGPAASWVHKLVLWVGRWLVFTAKLSLLLRGKRIQKACLEGD